MLNNFYVYLHIIANTGEPFYVGKGKSTRYKLKTCRSKYWYNIINKYDYDIIFLEENLNEKDAFELEKYWIKRIGRKDLKLGPLINFTNGGEGNSGKILSDETKEKMRKVKLGKICSNETKEKIKKGNSGKILSDETKEKISKSKLGKKHKPHKPHILSNENREKLKKINIGNKNAIGYGRPKLLFSVIQLDKETNKIIKIWNNHHDAAIFVNSTKPNRIIDCCNNICKTHKNFIWKFN